MGVDEKTMKLNLINLKMADLFWKNKNVSMSTPFICDYLLCSFRRGHNLINLICPVTSLIRSYERSFPHINLYIYNVLKCLQYTNWTCSVRIRVQQEKKKLDL